MRKRSKYKSKYVDVLHATKGFANVSQVFEYKELKTMTFGDVEGEEDKLLKHSLVQTYSIEEVLKLNCNYILAPKGAGKSAIFKSFEDRYFNEFYYNDKFIIAINRAFVFEDSYLSKDKFDTDDEKNCIISWGLYIFSVLLREIQKNLSENTFYGELKKDLSKFIELKEEFNLYSLLDYINDLNVGFKFNINGTEFDISPKISFNSPKKTISLNLIFEIINYFFNKNNLIALILIDKIDDFVRYEDYSTQKKYIHGLYGCIEEIRRLTNIRPILFLRSDLFYSLHVDIGLDKVMPRTVTLVWEKHEILKFIAQRLASNSYIKDNFTEAIKKMIPKSLLSKKQSIIDKILKKDIQVSNEEMFKCLSSKELEKFILLFFPQRIYHYSADGRKSKIDFIEWLLTHFKDNNNYINPRVLVNFFNMLFIKQYRFYTENSDVLVKGFGICALKERQGVDTLDVFDENVIYNTYKEIREKEILNVSSLLRDENHKKLFDAINTIIQAKGSMLEKDINFQNFNLSKEDFSHVLSYLVVLGYLKHEVTTDNEILFTAPIFYRNSFPYNMD